jgi:hypothetical protein
MTVAAAATAHAVLVSSATSGSSRRTNRKKNKYIRIRMRRSAAGRRPSNQTPQTPGGSLSECTEERVHLLSAAAFVNQSARPTERPECSINVHGQRRRLQSTVIDRPTAAAVVGLLLLLRGDGLVNENTEHTVVIPNLARNVSRANAVAPRFGRRPTVDAARCERGGGGGGGGPEPDGRTTRP